MKKILIVDAYNMIHRCRFNWGGGQSTGEYQIVFNFFRALKATVDKFEPDIVYFPLDGKPKARLDISDTYEANRAIETEDPEVIAYWDSFHRQKRIIIEVVKKWFPVITAYHPYFECDDIIYHLVKVHHSSDDITIVSNDTDFIQILNEFPNQVKLWNPVGSKYRENTGYDYVAWKSMVGDRSDNIPGVKGIGKKTATKILEKTGELEKRLEDSLFRERFNKSYSLIKLNDMRNEVDEIQYFTGNKLHIGSIVESFDHMGFRSILKEPYFGKFKEVFSKLLVENDTD